MPRPLVYTEVDALVQLGDAVGSVDTELSRLKEVNSDAADRLVDAIRTLTTTVEKAIKNATSDICTALERRS